MRRPFALFVLIGGLFFGPPSAFAVQPDEVLDDPVLEERARDISAGLRCLVCQNQSIDDSDASIARDLRILVRERIESGETDEEVVDYIVSRYGQFVLLKPVFSPTTILLWSTPLLVLLGGGLYLFSRRQAHGNSAVETDGAASLTAEEEARLRKALANDPSDK
ncbi:cytochrome c-type biogenesis protein CcmH [Notoacmeibacter marinus]|uniref:Cytochrome c-type biogenesis protein n=1 Tax=Notoacmeibacter marinus TaxID=1876515 RepID=A0A231UU50_9HYPH|nr:cytochrome c-type biogenesis protein [Notoacmeibacter marinus]OXS99433.1 cytochrome c-type biogenesis protein CcmH [Notoacmeibacter marinus]